MFKEGIMIEKNLLEKFSIFSDIHAENLMEIAQFGDILEFSAGQTIFEDGEKASDLYGVLDGEVELGITVKDKILKADIQYEEALQTRIETIESVIIVESIDPGEIFGWSAFIDPRLYTSDARCSQPARILSLPADELKAIFAQSPQVGFVFMERLSEIISRRLRNRTDKLVESWSQAFDVNRI